MTPAILISVLLPLVWAIKLEAVTKVVEVETLGANCKVKGSSLYMAVWCTNQFRLYTHTESTDFNLVWSATTVTAVEKTLDEGISFVQSLTLHHFDSNLVHTELPSKGPLNYFLSDEINVLRNDLNTFMSFYDGERLIRKLVLPAGLAYLYSATRTGEDLIQIIACIKEGTLCQFYELENNPDFVLTRVHQFDKTDDTLTQLAYTGKFVGFVSSSGQLRVYAVFDYTLTTIYETSDFDTELYIEKIHGTGTNNIWMRGQGTIQGFTWVWLDAIQLTSFQYIKISPRAYFDSHQFGFVFPYQLAHKALHTTEGVATMNDLISFDSNQRGIFMLGPYTRGIGMAVYYQPIGVQKETHFDIFYEQELKKCLAGNFLAVDNTCQKCMVGCKFCETLAVCQECTSTMILASTGLCTCKDRTFQNGAACIDCSANCALCSAAGCTTCDVGYMIDDVGGCVPFACAEGFYQVAADIYECKACQDGCANCQNGNDINDRTCRLCKSGYELQAKGVCKKCADNQFSDGSLCQNCESPCATCSSKAFCLSCETGKILADASLGFCQACVQGTYFTAGTCKPCVDKCDACFQANQCTICTDKYIKVSVTAETDGVKKTVEHCELCPSNQYRFNTTRCKPCVEYCNSCDSGISCKECQVGRKFDAVTLKCESIVCPEKTYLQGNTCVACAAGCQECSGACAATDLECADPPTCDRCEPYYELVDGECQPCADDQFYDPDTLTCKPCHSSCVTCNYDGCVECQPNMVIDAATGTCDICPDGTYLQDSMCVECAGPCGDCASNQYWDNSQQNCNDCAANCLACNYATCLLCEPEYKILADNLGCEKCPTGTKYKKDTNTCVACSANCLTCTAAAGCTLCSEPYVLSGGTCKACPAATYYNSGVCVPCSENCKVCDATGCLECNKNIVLTEYLTCEACPIQTFFVNNGCESCQANCNQCTATGCLACEDQYVLQAGQCSLCPDATFYENSSCKKCSSNCQQCASASVCQSCQDNYVLKNNQCSFQCADGFYGTEDFQCISCLTGCAKCTKNTCTKATCPASTCIECDSGLTLMDGVCLECEAGTYLSVFDGSCKTCPENCYHCLDKTECLECEAGYVRDTLQKDICVLNCGDSINIRNEICLASLGITQTTPTTTGSVTTSGTQSSSSNFPEINLVSDSALIAFIALCAVCLILLLATSVVGIFIYTKTQRKVIPNKFLKRTQTSSSEEDSDEASYLKRKHSRSNWSSQRTMLPEPKLNTKSAGSIRLRVQATTKLPNVEQSETTLRTVNPRSAYSHEPQTAPIGQQRGNQLKRRHRESGSSITFSDNMEEQPKFLDFPDFKNLQKMGQRAVEEELSNGNQMLLSSDYTNLVPQQLVKLNDSSITTQPYKTSYANKLGQAQHQGALSDSPFQIPVISISNIENAEMPLTPGAILVSRNQLRDTSSDSLASDECKTVNLLSRSHISGVFNANQTPTVVNPASPLAPSQNSARHSAFRPVPRHLLPQQLGQMSEEHQMKVTQQAATRSNQRLSNLASKFKDMLTEEPICETAELKETKVAKSSTEKKRSNSQTPITDRNMLELLKSGLRSKVGLLSPPSARASGQKSARSARSKKSISPSALKMQKSIALSVLSKSLNSPSPKRKSKPSPLKQSPSTVQREKTLKVSLQNSVSPSPKSKAGPNSIQRSQTRSPDLLNQLTIRESQKKSVGFSDLGYNQQPAETPKKSQRSPRFSIMESAKNRLSSKERKKSLDSPRLQRNEFTFQQNPRMQSSSLIEAMNAAVNFEQSKVEVDEMNFEVSKQPSVMAPRDSIQEQIRELGIEEELKPKKQKSAVEPKKLVAKPSDPGTVNFNQSPKRQQVQSPPPKLANKLAQFKLDSAIKPKADSVKKPAQKQKSSKKKPGPSGKNERIRVEENPNDEPGNNLDDENPYQLSAAPLSLNIGPDFQPVHRQPVSPTSQTVLSDFKRNDKHQNSQQSLDVTGQAYPDIQAEPANNGPRQHSQARRGGDIGSKFKQLFDQGKLFTPLQQAGRTQTALEQRLNVPIENLLLKSLDASVDNAAAIQREEEALQGADDAFANLKGLRSRVKTPKI